MYSENDLELNMKIFIGVVILINFVFQIRIVFKPASPYESKFVFALNTILTLLYLQSLHFVGFELFLCCNLYMISTFYGHFVNDRFYLLHQKYNALIEKDEYKECLNYFLLLYPQYEMIKRANCGSFPFEIFFEKRRLAGEGSNWNSVKDELIEEYGRKLKDSKTN